MKAIASATFKIMFVPADGGPVMSIAQVGGAIATMMEISARTPADDLAQLFPALDAVATYCPFRALAELSNRCGRRLPLGHLVQHLNDWHRWPRERIADWLDTLDIDLTVQPSSQGD